MACLANLNKILLAKPSQPRQTEAYDGQGTKEQQAEVTDSLKWTAEIDRKSISFSWCDSGGNDRGCLSCQQSYSILKLSDDNGSFMSSKCIRKKMWSLLLRVAVQQGAIRLMVMLTFK